MKKTIYYSVNSVLCKQFAVFTVHIVLSLLSLLKVLIFYVFVLYSVLVRRLVCSIISCLNFLSSNLMENFDVFGKCINGFQHITSEFSND